MSFKEARLQTYTNDTCANLFAYETVEDQADISDYYSSMVKAEYIPYDDRIFWSTVTVNFNRLNSGANISRVWLRLISKAGAKGRIRINNEIKEAVPDHFYMIDLTDVFDINGNFSFVLERAFDEETSLEFEVTGSDKPALIVETLRSDSIYGGKKIKSK